MSNETERYMFFYQFVWYQPSRIHSDEVAGLGKTRIFLEKGSDGTWGTVSNPASPGGEAGAALEMTPGHFEMITGQESASSDVQQESTGADDPYDLLSFTFNSAALKEISGAFSGTPVCEMAWADLLLLDSGVTSFNFLMEAKGQEPDKKVIDKLNDMALGLNFSLLPAFIGLIDKLKELGAVSYLKEVPKDFFTLEGAITQGLRYDCFLFVLGGDDEAFKRIVSDQGLSREPVEVDGFKVHLGWYFNAIQAPPRMKGPESFHRDSREMALFRTADLLQLGAFVGASATSDALQTITRDILDGKLDIKKSAVRSLIMQGRQVIGSCHSMKAYLSSSGDDLFEKLNEKAEVEREAQHFEDAVVNVLRGLDGLEQERTARADRIIQILLLVLAAVTLVSVIKDAVDFLKMDEWPKHVFWKDQTFMLSAVLLLVAATLFFVGRTISRR